MSEPKFEEWFAKESELTEVDHTSKTWARLAWNARSEDGLIDIANNMLDALQNDRTGGLSEVLAVKAINAFIQWKNERGIK